MEEAPEKENVTIPEVSPETRAAIAARAMSPEMDAERDELIHNLPHTD